jgi:hypothetical protein
MREFKRKIRVARLMDYKDPHRGFIIGVIVLHLGFVLGYLTLAVLSR